MNNINKNIKENENKLKKELIKEYNKINENNKKNKKENIKLERENRIEPLIWVRPNQKSFPEWINQTFSKYRLNEKNTEITSPEFKPFKYQEFLRDYLQENSPYRGVLLFHGLGSGKTCTAITIAENLKNERDIIVMLPASLKNNFIEQGLLYCGDIEYKKDIKLLERKYDFVSYNASNSLDQLKRIGTLDSKVIIIEEAHNFISKLKSGIEGGSVQGLEIYKMLMNAKDLKIIALTGTPIINDPFELAVLFNILRGYIEVTNFRIDNINDNSKIKEFQNSLKTMEYIDYSNVNISNYSIECHIMINHYHEDYDNIIDKIIELASQNNIVISYLNLQKYTLFHTENDGEKFYDDFVQINERLGDKIKNEEIFKRRIMGLVSYYVAQKKDYPETIMHDNVKVLMSDYQRDIYNIIREKEKKTEKGSTTSGKKKKRLSSSVQSMFRVYSRQACNFVFPEEIPRPYKNPKFHISLKKTKNEEQNDIDLDLKTFNEELEDEKISLEYKERQQKALEELEENSNIYLSKEGLDKYGPKMKAIIENIEKSEGPVFVYSDFRNMEGIELLRLVLNENGYSYYNENSENPKYAIYSGGESYEEKKDIIEKFNDISNAHGEKIKIILSTRAGVEGLDLKYIRQVHIMEPYWNNNRIKQAIGRAVRRGSHADLPPKERKVDVYKYIAILDESNSKNKKGEQLSTDEYINKIASNKQKLIDDLMVILKEASIDCILNKLVIEEDYNCLSFGKNANGLSYMPKVSKDIIESNYKLNTKKVQKKVITGLLDNKTKKIYLINKSKKIVYLYSDKKEKPVKINKKDMIQIGINENNMEIYDLNSIKKKNPIILGKLNIETSKLM